MCTKWEQKEDFYIKKSGEYWVQIAVPNAEPIVVEVELFQKLLKSVVDFYIEGYNVGGM